MSGGRKGGCIRDSDKGDGREGGKVCQGCRKGRGIRVAFMISNPHLNHFVKWGSFSICPNSLKLRISKRFSVCPSVLFI